MNKEDLFKTLNDIDSDNIKKAREYKGHKKIIWGRWLAAAASVAVIAGKIINLPAFRNIPSVNNTSGVMKVVADYPKPVAQNLSAQEFMESDEHWTWWTSYRESLEESEKLQAGIDGYYFDLMGRMLVSEDENTVCSPLNTYIAFAMLAEVCDGNTRQQLLDMLGADNIRTLRKNISVLWESNYADTPTLKSLLANSIWLDNDVDYNDDTLNMLAKQYYASSFSGVPGSEEMDEDLIKWTDDNTGGLLKDYTKNMHIQQDTVLEILSTIYFKASWTDRFYENDTSSEVFHGTKGDTTVNMMHKTGVQKVYRTDNFTALGLSINDANGSMYFLLPNENADVNELASDPDVMKVIRPDENDGNWSFPMVNLSVPKFKVSAKSDLIETVKELGITDALDPSKADFSPLTKEKDNLYLSKAEHAAMIEIDEQGVTGAAYTELAIVEGAFLSTDEIDLVFDRPFMFIVTGGDGSILFSGIVRNIE